MNKETWRWRRWTQSKAWFFLENFIIYKYETLWLVLQLILTSDIWSMHSTSGELGHSFVQRYDGTAFQMHALKDTDFKCVLKITIFRTDLGRFCSCDIIGLQMKPLKAAAPKLRQRPCLINFSLPNCVHLLFITLCLDNLLFPSSLSSWPLCFHREPTCFCRHIMLNASFLNFCQHFCLLLLYMFFFLLLIFCWKLLIVFLTSSKSLLLILLVSWFICQVFCFCFIRLIICCGDVLRIILSFVNLVCIYAFGLSFKSNPEMKKTQ